MSSKRFIAFALATGLTFVCPLAVRAETTGEKINRVYHTSIAAIDREALASDLLELESSLTEIEVVEQVNAVEDTSVQARKALMEEQLENKETLATEFLDLRISYEIALTTIDLDRIVSNRVELQNFMREHEITDGISIDTRLYSDNYVTSFDVSSEQVKREILAITNKMTSLNESVNYGNPPTAYPIEGTFTSGFGLRSDPFTGATAFHNGVDIAAPKGTPVKAWFNGTVKVATNSSGNGNYIVVEQGELSTVYAHLDTIAVKVGDTVSQGTIVGGVGSTGRSTGNHLHFGMYINGVAVDPSKLLKEG